MLTRILDTTSIDMENPELRVILERDLRRMDFLNHRERCPKGCDSYLVQVSHSTYFGVFCFNVQYGRKRGGDFEPRGETKSYSTETLPMI